MAKPLNCDMVVDKLYKGLEGRIAYIIIQRRLLEKQKVDLRIILLGGSSVGKTTLVFTQKQIDGGTCRRTNR